MTPVTDNSLKFITSSTTEGKKKRILLLGDPKARKTTFACEWPNPLVINFDNNINRAGVEEIPFWDPRFVDKVSPPLALGANFRDAVTIVMRTVRTIPSSKTLILDSLSLMEARFNVQDNFDPIRAKSGEIDKMAMFGRRLNWYNNIIATVTNDFAGTVIVIAHLAQDTDKDGLPTGKLLPAISGQMKNRIAGFFDNVWQAQIVDDGAKTSFRLNFKPSSKLALCTSFPAPENCELSYAAVEKLMREEK